MVLCSRPWTQGGATRASRAALLTPAARLAVAQTAYREGPIFVRSSYIALQFLKNIFPSKENDTISLFYARLSPSWKGLQRSGTHARRRPQEFSGDHLISVAGAGSGKDPVAYLKSNWCLSYHGCHLRQAQARPNHSRSATHGN